VTIEQDFETVRVQLKADDDMYDVEPGLAALSRIEAVQKLATEQVEWLQRTKRGIETKRDALRAALKKIGGLLDYWGNEGGWHDEHAIKCFRAVEDVLQALKEVEEK